MRSILFGLCMLGLSVGCSTKAEPTPVEPQPLKPDIQLSATEGGLEANLLSTSYQLFSLRDLWVRVRIPAMPALSDLGLVFTTPQGERFYETHAKFTTDAGMKTMPMPNMDHPLDVHPAKPIPGGYALDTVIPIGGTVFTRHPHAGTWTIEARVDRTVLVAPVEFLLTQ